MANEILTIDSLKDINTINIVCSTQQNGQSSIRLVRDNYPGDLTIEEIQSKFIDRFDEIRYYTVCSGFAPPNVLITPTPTRTPTRTPTGTPVAPTPTPTISITPTISLTPTRTSTITPTPTVTSTNSPTPSITPSTNASTSTPTPSITSTVTPTPSITPTKTITPTPTASYGAPQALNSNTANFNNCADWNSLDGNITTVGTNGISSPYGIYDLNGNVWEWTEALVSSNRVLRGGAYSTPDTLFLSSSYRGNNDPNTILARYGFRVASINNPNNLNIFSNIEDINNNADLNGYGSVSYTYKMSTNLITNNDYVEFLNSIASTDTYSVFASDMSTDPRSGISRTGSSGSYAYSVRSNMGNKPVNLINWYNAARYCNWLHNSKPSGAQDNNTTENGAYQLTGNSGSPTRDFGAKYFLPSENEWYKAAFYKSIGSSAGYWAYATQSDSAPNCISATSTGNGTL